jgi:copper(I)-binding protein
VVPPRIGPVAVEGEEAGVRRFSGAALAAIVVMTVAACGTGSSVEVTGVWARTSPAMASAGAVYMQITSMEGDRLLGASVDASVAAVTEIHETVAAGGTGDGNSGMGEDGDGMGMMTMRPVPWVDLPAGETVALEPGGLHVMLLGLVVPLQSGEAFQLRLTFEKAGEHSYRVLVRPSVP